MVFFERCVKSVSLIGDSVDRTAETQAPPILTKAHRGDMLDIAHGDTGGKVK